MRGPSAPRIVAAWEGRDLVYFDESQSSTWGRCKVPPEIITLPDLEHTSFALSGATVTLRSVDEDHNGLMEALEVDAAFVAPRPSSYRLTARFANDVTAQVTSALTAGPARLRVRFDPKALEEASRKRQPHPRLPRDSVRRLHDRIRRSVSVDLIAPAGDRGI
jgi:hypothetical protein